MRRERVLRSGTVGYARSPTEERSPRSGGRGYPGRRRELRKAPDEAKAHGIRRDENARMARHRSDAPDRARARRVQPRAHPADARANGDSHAYARPYRNASARRYPYSRADANADARPCPYRNAPAHRYPYSRAYANGAPDSAVRVPPKRPNAPERSGAPGANAYSSPDAPTPNGDRDARPHRDPYSRAADAYPRSYAYANARAVRRMARRPPRRLPPRRPRARRGAHARRRLVLDDRGSRRRQVRAPLLLRYVVTELRRRVSDAQRPLRRLQGRRRNRRRRLQR